MEPIDLNFRTLRVNLRKYGIQISEDVFERYHPATMNVGDEICVFCKSALKLTKEHVLPKWLFQKDVESTFISSVNRQTQSYNKAVVPTCSDCNNSILAKIEKHVIAVIQKIEIGSDYTIYELSDVIRWLEILDYKLQVYDCRRKYIKFGDSKYDRSWADLPVSHMKYFMEMNPFKALDYIRRAQRRITIKSKHDRLNSLVFFTTSKPSFDFFTQPDEYIFVRFPMYKLAVFYFLRERFESIEEAYKEALYFIKGVAKS